MGCLLVLLDDSEGRLDETAADFADRGVEIAEGPVNRPWNTREIVVHDPDGYTLVFFEPVDITRTFEDVMGNVSDSSTGHAPLT